LNNPLPEWIKMIPDGICRTTRVERLTGIVVHISGRHFVAEPGMPGFFAGKPDCAFPKKFKRK